MRCRFGRSARAGQEDAWVRLEVVIKGTLWFSQGGSIYRQMGGGVLHPCPEYRRRHQFSEDEPAGWCAAGGQAVRAAIGQQAERGVRWLATQCKRARRENIEAQTGDEITDRPSVTDLFLAMPPSEYLHCVAFGRRHTWEPLSPVFTSICHPPPADGSVSGY